MERATERGMPTIGLGMAGRATAMATLYLGVEYPWPEYFGYAARTAGALGANVVMLATNGRIEEARRQLHEILQWPPMGRGDPRGSVPTHLAHACVMLDERDTLLSLLPMVHREPPGGMGAHLPVASYVLGMAYAYLERPEESRLHFQQAIDTCTTIRFRPELALSHLGLAELLLDHYPDQHAEAMQHLDTAIAEFRDMKMQPSLERALRRKQTLGA